MRFLEKLILIGAYILTIVIGVGIAILVTKAIDGAEIKAHEKEWKTYLGVEE